MISDYDTTFAEALKAQIRLQLQGDKEKPGFYRQILACSDWPAYVRLQGMIYAYEAVLSMMNDVTKRMNDGEEPVRERRAGMN